MKKDGKYSVAVSTRNDDVLLTPELHIYIFNNKTISMSRKDVLATSQGFLLNKYNE